MGYVKREGGSNRVLYSASGATPFCAHFIFVSYSILLIYASGYECYEESKSTSIPIYPVVVLQFTSISSHETSKPWLVIVKCSSAMVFLLDLVGPLMLLGI